MRRETALTYSALAVLAVIALFLFRNTRPEFLGRGSKERQPPGSLVLPDPASASDTSTTPKAEPRPQSSPAELLEDAVTRFPSMPEAERDEAARVLIRHLRAFGPAGLEQVRRFLASGRDVKFRETYGLGKNRLPVAPSLRIALLDALAEWDGAAAALIEFLRSRSSITETVVATRSLERHFPGTYRAEAVDALAHSLAARGGGKLTHDEFSLVLSAAQHFKAVEVLPTVESLVVQEANVRVAPYVQLLARLPEETREAALEPFLETSAVRTALESDQFAIPRGLGDLSFASESVRTRVMDLLRGGSSARRLQFLNALEPEPAPLVQETFYQSSKQPRDPAADYASTAAEMRGRKEFLAAIEPNLNTPEEKKALGAARQRITEALAVAATAVRHDTADPVEVPFAQGAGNAVIKGRRVESLDLRAEPVPVLPPDPDSTPEPPR